MVESTSVPQTFIWKRLHSLTGLFLVLYLIEHLLVNSQAALFFGDDGRGFIRAVDHIHNLPYLPFIEMFLLGVPIVIHMTWGILYMRTGQQNYYGYGGNQPHCPDNPRNRAYTWQRITAWILLVGILAHVIHMRILEYPVSAPIGDTTYYMIRLKEDPGLFPLSARLGFSLYDKNKILESKKNMSEEKHSNALDFYSESILEQEKKQKQQWLKALESFPLEKGQMIAVTKSFGSVELLMVRDTFKMPLMITLYTIFVLSACFHGFNGLWTFLISWGITLTATSQKIMLRLATALMAIVTFWGLSTIWLTYWVNLKQ